LKKSLNQIPTSSVWIEYVLLPHTPLSPKAGWLNHTYFMSTPEFLSLGDVAATFGWTTRFVERLAAVDQLPGAEINGQWQFRRDDLIEWLDRKIQTLDTTEVANLEQKLEGELQAASRNIHIAERLKPNLVGLDIRVTGRIEVLKELVRLADHTGLVINTAHLHASLVEREGLCSTALPGGFAFCHPRRPSPHLLRRTLLTVLRTQQPVAFGAEDGEPTRLFFLIAAIDDRAHLYALARFTRIVRGATLEKLLQAPTAEDLIAIIRAREAEIDAAPKVVRVRANEG
jgi:mannitol/fructose-specific phosphotransferase system IIA component (Ntr-type)